MHAKSLQSCVTLCDPMDCSLPASSVGSSKRYLGFPHNHPQLHTFQQVSSLKAQKTPKDTEGSVAIHTFQGKRYLNKKWPLYVFMQCSFYKRILFRRTFHLSPYWFNKMVRNGYYPDFIKEEFKKQQ